MKTFLISAICTPLRSDESLHIEGLTAHLDDQWRHGIAGVFVAGTMGRMQLLADRAYRDLVRYATRLAAGCGEIMVGVGDTSFVRTLQRIQYVEQFDVDGVVVLAPFLHPLSQPDLIDYFSELANRSQKPLYLYDNPFLLPTKPRDGDRTPTVETSKHPGDQVFRRLGVDKAIDEPGKRWFSRHSGPGRTGRHARTLRCA